MGSWELVNTTAIHLLLVSYRELEPPRHHSIQMGNSKHQVMVIPC